MNDEKERMERKVSILFRDHIGNEVYNAMIKAYQAGYEQAMYDSLKIPNQAEYLETAAVVQKQLIEYLQKMKES